MSLYSLADINQDSMRSFIAVEILKGCDSAIFLHARALNEADPSRLHGRREAQQSPNACSPINAASERNSNPELLNITRNGLVVVLNEYTGQYQPLGQQCPLRR